MARDRARSSFTVEVRRGRSTPVETDPKRALWRGHDLAGEAARHEAVATTAEPVAAAASARALFARMPSTVPGREAPRILPSLIEAPAPVEEAAAPAQADERLPRVRRARRPRAERPSPEPEFLVPEFLAPDLLGPDPDEVFDEEADDASDGLPGAVLAEGSPEALAEPRLRRRQPRGERVLRAGERWKRRLPRALW